MASYVWLGGVTSCAAYHSIRHNKAYDKMCARNLTLASGSVFQLLSLIVLHIRFWSLLSNFTTSIAIFEKSRYSLQKTVPKLQMA